MSESRSLGVAALLLADSPRLQRKIDQRHELNYTSQHLHFVQLNIPETLPLMRGFNKYALPYGESGTCTCIALVGYNTF
jgi:hypothetical protein